MEWLLVWNLLEMADQGCGRVEADAAAVEVWHEQTAAWPADHKRDGHAVRAYNSHKVAGGGDKVAEISAGTFGDFLLVEWRDLASAR